jgi:hypothetical protein
MAETKNESEAVQLSADALLELQGELEQQLTVDQLRQLLALVNSSEDLDEALAALEQVERAA